MDLDQPTDRLLRRVFGNFRWDGPRNWFSEGRGGDWTVMYPKAVFMEFFDVLWVIAFILLSITMVNSAIVGDLKLSIYMIIYLFMLLLYELYFLVERLADRLGRDIMFTSAAIDWGDKHNIVRYVGVGAAGAFAYVLLSVVLQGIHPGEIVPLLSITGFMFIVMNAIAIPFAEESVLRGMFTPYIAESFGVIPAVLTTGAVTGILHQQIFQTMPQFAILSGIYGGINAIIVLKERALAPCVIGHILVNTFAVMTML